MSSDTSALLLMTSSFLLGLRHGVDWDHLAAIFDIVTSAGCAGKSRRECLLASLMYALGHGLVVIALGACAICFASVLPGWVDPVMEKLVGLTLVSLSIWVFYLAFRQFSGADTSSGALPLSRGLVLLNGLHKGYRQLGHWLTNQRHLHKVPEPFATAAGYNGATAFLVGLVHGIGAETGSQVLLLTSVASTSQAVGMAMLFSFAAGIIGCNLASALAFSFGFTSTVKFKKVLLGLSILTGVFSLLVGLSFLLGLGDSLPDLQNLLP
ncbi:MAG: hypothetical protein SFV17_17095 [Candidatus Obscuribacter sp.]|nr:hypothetical protein [Candidatus Melainabacteria bacterium]MDX1988406.1 hypothetical protein [Candidatus Obscuribacter sp.]